MGQLTHYLLYTHSPVQIEVQLVPVILVKY